MGKNRTELTMAKLRYDEAREALRKANERRDKAMEAHEAAWNELARLTWGVTVGGTVRCGNARFMVTRIESDDGVRVQPTLHGWRLNRDGTRARGRRPHYVWPPWEVES